MDLTHEDTLDWMRRGRQGITGEDADPDQDTTDDGESAYNDTFGTKDATADTRYSEGDKVVTDDGTRAIVVEVRTEPFEGPDGDDVDASDNSPAYVIATQDGAKAVKASNLKAEDWSTGRDAPDEELADHVAGDAEASALAASVQATLADLPDDFDPMTDGTLEAGPTDWDFPDSWEESDIPARLILLDAWSSMGGQFECGGACCKGTMMSSGMSDRASDQFCAAMKDRVLLWEGWRRGG